MNKQQTTACNPPWTPQELPTALQAIEMQAGREAARAGLPFSNTEGTWHARGWIMWHLTERPEPSWRAH